MKLPSIPYLADAFIGVVRRFPLVIVAATTGVVTAMLLIENSNNANEEAMGKILMASSLGLSTLLCSAIICEKWELSLLKALLLNVVATVLVVLYYLSLNWSDNFDSVVTPVRFIGLNLAAHLGVAFIPYLDRTPVEDFWEYNKRLFGNLVVGGIYSGVIFAGLSIAILATNELFNLDIDEKIYGHLFVFIAGIFNTVYFLANFPKRFDFSAEAPDNQVLTPDIGFFTTSFKNLTKFILIPIVAIYFLILYAFSAKILVQWQLPEGWVGKLVLGFSVAGIFTYLLNYLLVKYDESLAVKGYRQWFFYVLLPMIVLLFVAIGRRINDYGVTEPRYVVATAGIWLLLMSIYFIISKKDNIKFIPISLAFFSLLTVLGPLSAFKVSERNQTNRLTSILEKNNMLKDGKFTPPSDTLSKSELDIISGAVEYLGENGHFGKVANMFGLPEGTKSLTWEQRDSLLNILGVKRLSWESGNCYVSFSSSKTEGVGVDIKGYDKYFSGYLSNGQNIAGTFELADGNKAILFKENGTVLDSFDMRPLIAEIQAAGACGDGNGYTANDSLAVVTISSTSYEVKLLNQSLELKKIEKGWEVLNWNGKILLRKIQ